MSQNKDAGQLWGNHAADQLCVFATYMYVDSSLIVDFLKLQQIT